VKRRDFITLLGGAAAAWPIAARAQQSTKVVRLGYLAPARLPNLIEALRAGLRDFGYVEGQNLAIEYRFALGQTKSYDELAQELVSLDPAAIVLTGTPAALAYHDHSHHPGPDCRPNSTGPCEKPRASWGQRDRCHDVWH
jgi:putative tryptophan/tyrosine transport system substrate-binding protein